MSVVPVIKWHERGAERQARWHSASGATAPGRVEVADDSMSADRAYRMACEGTGLLWRGDFQNARLLLQALMRRVDAKPDKPRKPRAAPAVALAPAQAFHLHRMAQAQRARILGMLLLPFDAGHVVPLRRAPDVQGAGLQAWGAAAEPYVASLRELLGAIGAFEWRRKGVEIAALRARIHPHYGVFSPVRGEYLALVAKAPLKDAQLAFDIGTGTGVLAALLAHRRVPRVVATDNDARALTCARDNITRLGLAAQVQVIEADLFPPGQAPLVVCNPPWVPARPAAPLEHAIYDPESRMLRGYLAGLAAHLTPDGEGWLIMSDLAEHLGLRAPALLANAIAAGGLRVVARIDTRPQHAKAYDAADPLHAARKAEVTTLWRLAAA